MLETYTSPTRVQKDPNFVMYVYNTIQFCLEAYTASQLLQLER